MSERKEPRTKVEKLRAIIRDRIDESIKRVGCSTAKEFSVYARKHGGEEILESTISKWYRLKSTPSVDNLLYISRLCDCDLDYLLGRQSEPLKEDSTVHDITGLSEESIKAIKSARHVHLLQRTQGTLRAYDTGTDCINWFIEKGLLPILGSAWAVRIEKKKYNAEREKIPKSVRDIVDKVSRGLEGVTTNDKLLRSAVLRELNPLSDKRLRDLSEDDYFRDLDKYKRDKYEFSDTVMFYTSKPDNKYPDYKKYAFPMAYLIADKEHDYMMYARERDLKKQVVINKFAKLLDEYMDS